jgi:hypothetical protein
MKSTIEYHYTNGDVGVHPTYAHHDRLWGEFPDNARTQGGHTPSHIVIRPDNEWGQKLSNRLAAVDQLLEACLALKEAYRNGERRGGSIDWEDVDCAYEKALVAIHAATHGATAKPEQLHE